MKNSTQLAGICIALVAALATACARQASKPPDSKSPDSKSPVVVAVAAPVELAVADAANAHVTLASDGDRVVAAWAATGTAGTNVFVARSADGGRTFASPSRVNDIEGDASVNGEAPPRVIVSGSNVDVVWTSKRGGIAGIRSAASSDGGARFAPARTVTAEGVTGARGWQTAAFGSDGTVHVAWLDGRNAAAGGHHDGDMRQDIYHAMWRGTAAPVETAVAPNVCFCCKTALASRGDTVYIAWRHLFPGGVRDIALARSSDGGRTFSPPVRVSADNWQIDACPDDGPSLALAEDGAVHVAWPTMVEEASGKHMGVFTAVSRDGGLTFSQRARVDSDLGAAHPKVALDGAGRPAVVWDEIADRGRRIRLRVGMDAPRTLSGAGIASYPSITLSSGSLLLAWTDQTAGRSRIHVERGP